MDSSQLDSTYYMVPWIHVRQSPKRHLDRFSRFCTIRHRDRHTQTDTQTTLRVAYVAIGRIYAMYAMWPNNSDNYII